MKDIIAQGAEAIIYYHDGHLIKERVRKYYRLEEIDNKIRKFRTRRERTLLEKAAKVIPVPKVFANCDKKMTIDMEFIEGKKLSECLDEFPEKKRLEVCELIGEQVAKLHDANIIHGDLTTSNMILDKEKLYFIDFGLGFEDIKAEHKAVDLHLLRQALESKHYKHYESSYKAVLNGYKKSKNYTEVMKRLEKVESRGRYKDRSPK